jgi:hypothetical protein
MIRLPATLASDGFDRPPAQAAMAIFRMISR